MSQECCGVQGAWQKVVDGRACWDGKLGEECEGREQNQVEVEQEQDARAAARGRRGQGGQAEEGLSLTEPWQRRTAGATWSTPPCSLPCSPPPLQHSLTTPPPPPPFPQTSVGEERAG
eukprot:768335-Hanusia_phi.AAC.6